MKTKPTTIFIYALMALLTFGYTCLIRLGLGIFNILYDPKQMGELNTFSRLTAGLGMVDQAHSLIPEARVGFVGVARDESAHKPVPYLESLPADLRTQPVMVLDPMLATGGSMVYTLELLTGRGARDITVVCVVCAPEGVAALEKAAPQVRLFTAAIDDGLNDDAYIVPGLGDAGDRMYGTK